MVEVKPWFGPIKLFMKLCKFQGWTSFWNVIYLDPEYLQDEKLIKHEMTHIKQINEEGKIKFSIKYLFWTCRYGYWNNPYEVEARLAETK
tara:strand:- start:8265 stop:8534 length:270 start_codon:yes stop_codon:yes gene_type:complete